MYVARLLGIAGNPGERYTAGAVARTLGVKPATVCAWIRRGWLRASWHPDGHYMVRKAAIRKALRHPRVAETVANAAVRKYVREA